MKKIIIIVFFIGLAHIVCGQNKINIDSLFASLDNTDLYIAPKVGGLSITARASQTKEKTPKLEIERFVISSLSITFDELVSNYSRDSLIKKLYVLLVDNKRDLYANAMLYQLTGNNNHLAKLMGVNRNDWVSSGEAAIDKKHWKDTIIE